MHVQYYTQTILLAVPVRSGVEHYQTLSLVALWLPLYLRVRSPETTIERWGEIKALTLATHL